MKLAMSYVYITTQKKTSTNTYKLCVTFSTGVINHTVMIAELKEVYPFGSARLTCVPKLLLQDVLKAAEHCFVLS